MALGTHSQQKNRKEGEDLSRPVQFFLPSLPGVYEWVTSTIFGGGQSVKKIGCEGKQAGSTSSLII